jgi:hypothetical protein
MRARIKINQIVDRVRNGVSDMSYAQRLVFENRTGVATTGHDRRHGFSRHGRDPVIATSARDSRRSTSGHQDRMALSPRRFDVPARLTSGPSTSPATSGWAH